MSALAGLNGKEVMLRRPNEVDKSEKTLNIHNLSEIRYLTERAELPVKIFLATGVCLDCSIVGFDDVCLITTQKGNNKKRQLVYKVNIASIVEV